MQISVTQKQSTRSASIYSPLLFLSPPFSHPLYFAAALLMKIFLPCLPLAGEKWNRELSSVWVWGSGHVLKCFSLMNDNGAIISHVKSSVTNCATLFVGRICLISLPMALVSHRQHICEIFSPGFSSDSLFCLIVVYRDQLAVFQW